MRALIVFAHPEPASFGAAMRQQAQQALRRSGYEVQVSDLYAMRFDPVSDRRNFRSRLDPQRLRLQEEELHAAEVGGFAPELRAEMDKLLACDLLCLVFPIWWLGMPAILKGWVDRVFACGVAYGGGRRFDTGVLRGKRALCIVSVGGPERAYGDAGDYAPIETVLYPVHRGVLEFSGFEVLPPFVVYAPSRMTSAQREATLARLHERLSALPANPPPSASPTAMPRA